MTKKKNVNVKEILKLYFEDKMSTTDISKIVNLNSNGVGNRIKKAGYKLRGSSEAHKLKPSKYWLGKHCPNASSEGHKKAMKEWWKENKDKDKGKNILSKLNTKESIGEKNRFYGKNHTEETKKIIKEKRSFQVTPVFDTSIEIKIQDFLRQLQIPFHAHHYISEIEHKYNCDIFIPSIKTIVECDGDYWHGNPEFYSEEELTEKIKKQKQFDEARNVELKDRGYNVIRLWENEINKMALEDFKTIITIQREVGL